MKIRYQKNSLTVTTAKTVQEMLDETDNAFSFDRYGESGWRGAIKVLRKRGLNDLEVEAFLRSKHMRWAGDRDEKRPYGKCNGQTVEEYLRAIYSDKEKFRREIHLLVVGTFPHLAQVPTADGHSANGPSKPEKKSKGSDVQVEITLRITVRDQKALKKFIKEHNIEEENSTGALVAEALVCPPAVINPLDIGVEIMDTKVEEW